MTSLKPAVLILLVLTGLTAFASPCLADSMFGTFSAGLGAGMGDEDTAPFVISGKFWSRQWEAGAELYYDGDEGDTIDQFVLGWAMYRYDIHYEDRNTLYSGVGAGTILEGNNQDDSFGLMLALGWDGKDYGLEFKYGYFNPSIYSFVAYYNF